MKNRKIQAVIIGDSTADQEKYDFACLVGKILADNNITLITGGRGGVMEAASKGAFESGGITVGILPSNDPDDANEWCTISIPTGMGHARNALTSMSADFIIAIGGGAGTLTEIGFGWIYEKPIIAITKFGGWAKQTGNTQLDARRMDKIFEVSTLEELREVISQLVPEVV